MGGCIINLSDYLSVSIKDLQNFTMNMEIRMEGSLCSSCNVFWSFFVFYKFMARLDLTIHFIIYV